MSTALVERQPTLDPKVVASVLLHGDMEKLTEEQRAAYCLRVCETLGLNAHTQPFAFIRLNGKLVMYAKKDATEQLRKLHGVSITEVSSTRVEDVFVVTAKALDRDGRTDASTGAVAIGHLKGEALANGLMKAETKAKRRVTLSICGLGMLDETEVEDISSREPHYTVEAPTLVTLPVGTCQILKVKPCASKHVQWADVTYVTHAGEQKTLPAPADAIGASAALLEQLAQEAVPVVIETKIAPRKKTEVIASVKRWSAAVDVIDAAPAEVVTAESIPF
jgi:hypothetical protein